RLAVTAREPRAVHGDVREFGDQLFTQREGLVSIPLGVVRESLGGKAFRTSVVHPGQVETIARLCGVIADEAFAQSNGPFDRATRFDAPIRFKLNDRQIQVRACQIALKSGNVRVLENELLPQRHLSLQNATENLRIDWRSAALVNVSVWIAA